METDGIPLLLLLLSLAPLPPYFALPPKINEVSGVVDGATEAVGWGFEFRVVSIVFPMYRCAKSSHILLVVLQVKLSVPSGQMQMYEAET